MNRQERLRRIAPADLKERAAAELGDLPVAQVELIQAIAKASHRAGREYESQMRRRRREGRRPDRTGALDRLAARMATSPTPDDLTDLIRHYQQAPVVLQAVVDQLRRARPEPFSWAEIGAAAGITRQSAHERWCQGSPDTAQDAGTGAA